MATIKSVEVRVQSSIKSVEVGGGIPGSPGTDGTDGADGVSITGASINGSGHLILTLSSGGPIDVGLVVGADGTDGTDGTDGADGVSITGAMVDGSGHLILSLSTGDTVDAGLVVGADGTDGTDGADGVSITGATVDGSYHLILTLSSGGPIDAGYVRGPAGAGTGDVLGPASAVNNNFAAFDTTTGKAIKDSGSSASSFATAAQGTKADSAVQPGDTHAASSKATPVDADEIGLQDSAASYGLKRLTWANLKATLKTYFDALYQAASSKLTDIAALAVTDGNFIVGNGTTWVAESGATARTSLGLGTVATLNTGTGSGNVPVLDGSGKLVTSILPAMALTDTFVVASQAAMLALSAEQGDLAIRTDVNKSFVLSSNNPSTLADWKELLTPTDAVLSVAGLTGAITASGLRSALNLVIGTDVQAKSDLLTAIAGLGANGLVARTASGTAAARTITGTTNEITITNGDGVSGNPTASLPAVAKPYGKHAVPIPAGAMKARTTNGAASGTVEMTTNKNMVTTLDFDASTQEFAQFSIFMPKSWDETTITFVPHWSHAATSTNFGVVWQLHAVAVSNDDSLDVAFGTAQTSTDTGGTTNDFYSGPESSAITIAGTPAENDMVMFQIARVPTNGSDTMAIDARLHGITLYITTNAGNDA